MPTDEQFIEHINFLNQIEDKLITGGHQRHGPDVGRKALRGVSRLKDAAKQLRRIKNYGAEQKEVYIELSDELAEVVNRLSRAISNSQSATIMIAVLDSVDVFCNRVDDFTSTKQSPNLSEQNAELQSLLLQTQKALKRSELDITALRREVAETSAAARRGQYT